MIGAKVDMDKARKEKLCFNCGKAGHQAKYCRNKKPFKKEAPTKIGMMSYGLVDPGQGKLQYVPIPENGDMFDFESDLEENYDQALLVMTINLTRRKVTFQHFLAAVVHFQVLGLHTRPYGGRRRTRSGCQHPIINLDQRK